MQDLGSPVVHCQLLDVVAKKPPPLTLAYVAAAIPWLPHHLPRFSAHMARDEQLLDRRTVDRWGYEPTTILEPATIMVPISVNSPTLSKFFFPWESECEHHR